jgi:hypothetical protein
VDHGDDPVDQVAEPVGEFIVGAADEPVNGEVGVSDTGHADTGPS